MCSIHYTILCLSLPVDELLCSTAVLPLFDWPLLNNTFVAVLVATAVSVVTGCCGNTGRWFIIDIHSSKQWPIAYSDMYKMKHLKFVYLEQYHFLRNLYSIKAYLL